MGCIHGALPPFFYFHLFSFRGIAAVGARAPEPRLLVQARTRPWGGRFLGAESFWCLWPEEKSAGQNKQRATPNAPPLSILEARCLAFGRARLLPDLCERAGLAVAPSSLEARADSLLRFVQSQEMNIKSLSLKES